MGESRRRDRHERGLIPESEDAMAERSKRAEELAAKYGAGPIDDAERKHGVDFPAIVDWADEIDPHYAKIWLDFTYSGMYQRGILDERTRTLVVVGQFVAM